MSKYIKKIVTGLWAALLVTMIIILLAFLAIQLPFVQRWAAGRLSVRASEALGLPVGIDRVRYTPFSTVMVDGVCISDRDSLPMISVCSARAYISLLSLIKGDVTVHNIEVDSVSVGLRQSADGAWNIADLARQDSVESSPDMAFEIGSVKANHCDVVVYPWGKKRFVADNMSLSVSDINKSSNGFGATLSDFSFDAASWGAHFSMGGHFAASGDTLAMGSARMSLGGCVAKIDTLAAIVDSAGVRHAVVDIPKIRATGFLASKIIGREIPSAEASLKATYDNGDIKLAKVRLTAGEESSVTIKDGFAHLDIQQNQQPKLTRLKISPSGSIKPSDITAFLPQSGSTETIGKIPALPFNGIVTTDAVAGVARFDIASDLGKATITAAASSYDDWHTAETEIDITTTGFSLSQLTNGTVSHLDSHIHSEGSINIESGYWLRSQNMKAGIGRIDILGQSIGGISIDCLADSTDVSGELTINDRIAKLRLNATAQMSSIAPSLTLLATADSVRMDEIAPSIFKTPHTFSINKLSLNTTGFDIRTSETSLIIKDIALASDTDKIAIDSIRTELGTEGGLRTLNLISDIATVKATGNFDLPGLVAELQTQANLAMPDLFDAPTLVRRRHPHPDAPQQADIDAQLRNYKSILKIFAPDIEPSDTLDFRGHVDSEGHFAWARLKTPSFTYGDLRLDSIGISVVSNDGQADASANVFKFHAPVIGNLHNLRLDAECEKNIATADIEWGDKEINSTWTKHGDKADSRDAISGFVNLDAEVEKEDGGTRTWYVSIDKSKLPVFNKNWDLDSCRLAFAADYIDVGNFNAFAGEQSVRAWGRASKSAEDTLQVSITKLVLEDLLNIDPKAKYSLKGDLTLSASASSVMDSMSLSANATIDRLYVNGDNLEQFKAETNYHAKSDTLGFGIAIVTGGKPRAEAKGLYDLKSNYLSIPFDIDSLSTGFLNFYLDNCIDHWSGSTSGKLKLQGPLDALSLDARLKMNDENMFRVKQTDVWYYLQQNDSVILSPKSMDFLDIRFVDSNGRKGIFSGSISHDMFSGLYMHLDFKIDDAMLLLQTDAQSNPSYYGNVYGSGTMKITGPTSNVKMEIEAMTAPNTSFTIAPNVKSDISDNNTVRIVSKGQKTTDLTSILGTGTSATLKLHITPDANLVVMVDPAVGNKLTCRGSGDVTVDYSRTGDFTMNGTYTIESGTYNFVVSLVSKTFEINNGGTISWNGGDPYNADINITATYRQANPSLSTLTGGMSLDGSSSSGRRIRVECITDLKGNLQKPDITFDIKIPSTQSLNFSQQQFEQYVNTQEELSRQFVSLLTIGQFQPVVETSSQSSQTQSYIGMAASEVLSNKLSSMISQNEKNVNVGVNYRPGDQMSDEEYSVALSTQAFDGKVTISGNLGYGRDVSGSSSDDGTLIGDFDLEVKINKKGNIRAKAYTHSNNDVIYETSPTTQGIGVSYQEEFDSFRELIKSYWNKLFHRKKNKEIEAEDK